MTLREIAFGLVLVFWAGTGSAQGLFSPVITVDGTAITQYEVTQRVRLLEALGNVGAGPEQAREGLIEDRLRLNAARSSGLGINEEGMENSMTEFAGRANLTLDEFMARLSSSGVDPATFQDFVRAGALWRELVRQRFRARVQISDAEIDRAVGAAGQGSGLRVLISEIILPARPELPQEVATSTARAERLSQITSIAEFSAQARAVSVTPSRDNGGRLDWLPINELPGQLRTAILALSPGEVSEPIDLPNAIALFQLRAIEEVAQSQVAPAAIEYAAFYIPGGLTGAAQREAAEIEARVDTCDDLYGVAQGFPEERLERGSLAPADIPQDVALELAKLDENEVSTTLTRAGGETVVFLMLCGRTASLEVAPDRETVRLRLQNQRLQSYANSYLEELRAAADIVVN